MPIATRDFLNTLSSLRHLLPKKDNTGVHPLLVVEDKLKHKFPQGGFPCEYLMEFVTENFAQLGQDFVLQALLLTISNLDKKNLDEQDRLGLTKLLCIAMTVPINQLVELMITRKLGVFGTQPGIEGDFNPLLYSIWAGNQTAFDALLPLYRDKGLLNEPTISGETALFLAVSMRKESMVEKLLNEDEIALIGNRHNRTLMDLVRDDKVTLEKIIGAYNDNQTMNVDNWSFPIGLPLAMLHSKQQEYIYKTVVKLLDQHDFFQNHPQTAKRMMEFLSSDVELGFPRLNRLAIVHEALGYFLHPEWINQHATNLCGPAVVMQQLVTNDPDRFFNVVLDLAELNLKKKSEFLPANVKQIPKYTRDTAYDLSTLWQETIRHNYNAMVGFSPDHKYASYTALTTPHLLARMFEDFGMKVLQENLQVRFSKNTTLSAFMESARPTVAKFGFLLSPYKIYGAKHAEQPGDTVRFNQFLDWVNREPADKFFTIMVNRNLLNEIIESKNKDTQTVLEFSHYVNIRNFKYDSDTQKVSFECATFGNLYEVKALDVKTFAANFLGGFQLEKQPHLQHVAKPK